MTVTFVALTSDGFADSQEPCLCTQMADCFGAFVDHERDDWEALKRFSYPECWSCDGSGVEKVRVDLRPNVTFANDNTYIILNAMGLLGEDLTGEADLPTIRRGIIRARNVSHPEVLRAHVCRRGLIMAEYTRVHLMDAVSRLAEVVQVGAARGATGITWA